MKAKRWLYILLGLTLAFIWGNSLMPASVSGAISDFVKEILMSILSRIFGVIEDTADGGLLRKIAHMTEFAALGAELWLVGTDRKWPPIQVVFWGLATGFLDETIQIFVPGRNGAIRDVWIDMGGFVVGVGLCIWIYGLWKKKLK